MTKTLSLLAGAAIIAGATGASAADLLTADQMDGVTAGTYFSFNYTKNYYGDVDEYISSYLNLDGNSAEATAEANALGNGYGSDETLAVTGTQAFAAEPGALCYWCGGESHSKSVSIAAVD